jgi:integrase
MSAKRAPSENVPPGVPPSADVLPGVPRNGGLRLSRKQRLTQARLDALATRRLTARVDISDDAVTGLVARVWPSGAVTFSFRRRKPGGGFERVRLDAADLEAARAAAVQARAAAAVGRDIRSTPAALSQAGMRTVEEALEAHADRLAAAGRAPAYVANLRALARNYVVPVIGRVRMLDLSRADLTRLYDAMGKVVSAKASRGRGGRLTAQQNRVHALMIALVNAAIERGEPVSRDVLGMPRPIGEEPNQKRLADDDREALKPAHVAAIWCAAEREPEYARALVRLLCLLPLRREELTQLRWDEVRGLHAAADLDAAALGAHLDLAAERMKGRRRQRMPLSSAAAGILRSLEKRGDYVFPGRGEGSHYAGWTALAARLRAATAALPEGWVVHDLRGAIVTALEEADVSEAVTARLLHHSEVSRRGVTARYSAAKRLSSMRDALDLWARILSDAVEAHQRREVVPMRVAAGR